MSEGTPKLEGKVTSVRSVGDHKYELTVSVEVRPQAVKLPDGTTIRASEYVDSFAGKKVTI